MAQHQIVGRLGAAERAAFEAYVDELDLDAAGVLVLLWMRELRVDRLALLERRHAEPPGALGAKVVARLRSAEHKRRVVDHAHARGFTVSRACATLVRAEVAERWLARAMRLDESRGGSERVL